MMRKIFAALLFAIPYSLIPNPCLAQVPVTATHIVNAAQQPIVSAKLCFAPVDATQAPVGFRTGSTQVVPGAACGAVANGVLQSGFGVVASATGTYYHIYLTTAYTNAVLRDYGMTAITGSSWTLDTFDVNQSLPVAFTTLGIGAVSPLAPGATPTVTNSGNSAAAILNFGIPSGAPGATGPAGGLQTSTFASLPAASSFPGGTRLTIASSTRSDRIAIPRRSS